MVLQTEIDENLKGINDEIIVGDFLHGSNSHVTIDHPIDMVDGHGPQFSRKNAIHVKPQLAK